jgi:hypothetical protein
MEKNLFLNCLHATGTPGVFNTFLLKPMVRARKITGFTVPFSPPWRRRIEWFS